MRFCWCTIRVRDMERSLDFYQNIIGLEISERFTVGDEVDVVFLGKGETKVELIHDPNKEPASSPYGITLGFEVDSLDGQLDFVKNKGIHIVEGPLEPAPGIKFFFIEDPDGVNIQFVEKNH